MLRLWVRAMLKNKRLSRAVLLLLAAVIVAVMLIAVGTYAYSAITLSTDGQTLTVPEVTPSPEASEVTEASPSPEVTEASPSPEIPPSEEVTQPPEPSVSPT